MPFRSLGFHVTIHGAGRIKSVTMQVLITTFRAHSHGTIYNAFGSETRTSFMDFYAVVCYAKGPSTQLHSAKSCLRPGNQGHYEIRAACILSTEDEKLLTADTNL